MIKREINLKFLLLISILICYFIGTVSAAIYYNQTNGFMGSDSCGASQKNWGITNNQTTNLASGAFFVTDQQGDYVCIYDSSGNYRTRFTVITTYAEGALTTDCLNLFIPVAYLSHDKIYNYSFTGTNNGYFTLFDGNTFPQSVLVNPVGCGSITGFYVTSGSNNKIYNVNTTGGNLTGGFSSILNLVGTTGNSTDLFGCDGATNLSHYSLKTKTLIDSQDLTSTGIKKCHGLWTNATNGPVTDIWITDYSNSHFIYHLSTNNVSGNNESGGGSSNLTELNIVYPLNNSNLSKKNININYTTNVVPSACWYSNNSGQNNNTITCGQNITGVTWLEGINNIIIWANDSITSNEVSSRVTFTVDIIFPSINITYPPNNSVILINNPNITYSILNNTPLFNCWYSNDTYSVNTSLASCTTNISIIWIDGNHNITVWANDSNGVYNSSRITFNVTTFPNIQIVYPANNSVYQSSSNNLNINYTASDKNNNIASCWYSNDTYGVNTSLTDCLTNITSVIWSAGYHNVTVWVNDTNNDVNSSTVSFRILKQPVNPSTYIGATIDLNLNGTYYGQNLLWMGNYTGTAYEEASPVYENGVVYFVSRIRERAYAINASTGAEIWNFTLGTTNESSLCTITSGVYPPSWYTGCLTYSTPIIDTNAVYFPTHAHNSSNNNIYALNKTTGALLWNYTVWGGVRDAVYDDTKIYFTNGVLSDGAGDTTRENISRIYALNKKDGTLNWTYDIPASDSLYAANVFTPSIINGVFFTSFYNKSKLWGVYLNGSSYWNVSLLVAPNKGTWDNGITTDNMGRLYVSADRMLDCYNFTDGSLLWDKYLSLSSLSFPSYDKGVVFISTTDGYLYGFNSTNGTQIWITKIGAGTDISSPTIANGLIFISNKETNNASIVTLNETNGAILNNLKIVGSDMTSINTIGDGRLFVSADNWYLYAFDLGYGDENWLMGARHDILGTGTSTYGLYDWRYVVVNCTTSLNYTCTAKNTYNYPLNVTLRITFNTTWYNTTDLLNLNTENITAYLDVNQTETFIILNRSLLDLTPPYFTNNTPQNQTLVYKNPLSYYINASDDIGMSCFTVNNTNFKINCSGYLQNNTDLGAGLYNLNITINDTSNNFNSRIMYVNVTQATSQTSLTFDKTSPQVYGTAITPTCSLITGVGSVALTNGTSGSPITLGAGNWTFNCSYVGNTNYTASSNFTLFNITKAGNPVTLLLNGLSQNISVYNPQQTNATGTATAGVLVLYKNGVNDTINNGLNVTLAVGNYTYKANATGNANYSDNATGLMYNINVSTTPDTLYPIFSNYWDNNATQKGTGTGLFNVTLLSTNGTVILTFNNTNYTASNNSGSATTFNVTITGLNESTYNYNWASWGNGASHNFNVSNLQYYTVNTSYPIFSGYWDNNGTQTKIGTAYLNVTLLSTNGTVILTFNNTNYTASNISGNPTTFNVTIENLVNGTYYYNWSSYSNGNSHSYNISNSQSYTILNDLIPPNIQIIYPSNNTNTPNIQLNVNYTASDNIGLSTCWYSNSSGKMNYTLSSCANITGRTWLQGINNVTIWVNDTSGNQNNSRVTFTVDNIAPYFINLANQTLLQSQSLNYDIDAADAGIGLGTFAINWTNTFSIVPSTGILTNTSGLSVGDYYINVSVNDTLGNMNSSILLINVTNVPDTINPQINITSPLNNTNTSNIQIDVDYIVSDNYAIGNCWYSNTSGAVNYTLVSCANITGRTWLQGINNVTIWVNDTSGNQNSSRVTFTVDNIAPIVTLVSPINASTWTSDSTVTFTYNVTDSNDISNCSLMINNILDQINNTAVTKNISQTFTKLMSNANYNWSVNCTDASNNRGNSSVSFFTLSYTAPTTPPGGGGGGGGGGSGTTPTNNTVTNSTQTTVQQSVSTIKTISLITPEIAGIIIGIDKLFGVDEVDLEVNSQNKNVQINITKYFEKPSDVPEGNSAYMYLSIDIKNLTDLENGMVTIHVGKDWLSSNNIERDNVTLFQLDNGTWNELDTTYINTDDNYYYYIAKLNHFGYFYIGGKVTVENTTSLGEKLSEIWNSFIETTRHYLLYIFIGIGALIIAVAGIIFFKKRKEKRISSVSGLNNIKERLRLKVEREKLEEQQRKKVLEEMRRRGK